MARNGRPTIVRRHDPNGATWFSQGLKVVSPSYREEQWLPAWTRERSEAYVFPSRAEAQRTVFGEGISYEDAEEEA